MQRKRCFLNTLDFLNHFFLFFSKSIEQFLLKSKMIIANTVGIIKKKTIGNTFLTSAYTKQGIKIISNINKTSKIIKKLQTYLEVKL